MSDNGDGRGKSSEMEDDEYGDALTRWILAMKVMCESMSPEGLQRLDDMGTAYMLERAQRSGNKRRSAAKGRKRLYRFPGIPVARWQ